MTDIVAENKPRIREIQRELSDIDQRQKNLLQELYGLMGIRTDHTSIKTSRNRLSREQARRLCGC